ncbi:MAG: hypothetical protein U0930_17560 [Pirellulales bacterium]
MAFEAALSAVNTLMSQQYLIAVLVFALALVLSIGCAMKSETETAQEASELAYSRLKTAEKVQRAVNEATSHSNAILLVHVDWAPMTHQRQRFAEFKRSYKKRHPNIKLIFEYIDCTPITDGYEPLRSLPGWKELENQNNGSSLVHGYGELVWCKNGVVLHVERPLDFESADALVAKTEALGMASIAQ